jgi:hypothetical protein
MEQLNDPIFKLEAIVVNGDGGRAAFTLYIFDGEGDEHNHFCWLRCPHIRDRDVKITGVDKQQAFELAIWLVQDQLSHKGETLADENGKIIYLPQPEREISDL